MRKLPDGELRVHSTARKVVGRWSLRAICRMTSDSNAPGSLRRRLAVVRLPIHARNPTVRILSFALLNIHQRLAQAQCIGPRLAF